ncbi:MAG TPA: hypothetical protein PKG95_00385 [Anaerolineaceae bacterium]|nr:hypothetical protein [Anaerolineaceae bacterium]
MPNSCPICDKDDLVKKVSAIVRGGSFSQTGQIPVGYSYTDSEGKLHTETRYENFSTSQISRIASRLSPPPPPEPFKNKVLYFATLLVWGGFSIFSIIGSFIFFVMLILQIFGFNVGSNQEVSDGVALLSRLLSAFLSLIFGMIFGYLTFKLVRMRAKREATYKLEKPLWEQSMLRWQQLYYCERDDSIFIPGEPAVPVTALMDYIHWKPYAKLSLLERLINM